MGIRLPYETKTTTTPVLEPTIMTVPLTYVMPMGIILERRLTIGKIIDLTGQQFGRLRVVEFLRINQHRKAVWRCLCSCGNTTEVTRGCLRDGYTKSCGCVQQELLLQRNTKHGFGKRGGRHPLYPLWLDMRNRCNNPKDRCYKNYGGRGIKVCERWDKFENFLADMGDRPPGMKLERINNNGNYEPTNCKWATQKVQMNNTRRNVWIYHEGETKTLSQWAQILSINYGTIWSRLYQYDWSIERAFNTPVKKR
jgi:hypothetical protein